MAAGLYWYCADHHSGQWSLEYAILSSLPYRPGASERGPEPDSVAAEVYASLADGRLDVALVRDELTRRLDRDAR